MSIARRLSGPALAVAGTLLMTGCGTLSPAPAQLEAPEASAASEHLSASTFAVTVLAATRRAGSVHTRRIETVRGETTRMVGDTHFGGDRYQGRFTVAIVPPGGGTNAYRPAGELRLLSGRVYLHVPGVVPDGKFLSVDADDEASAVGQLCACAFSHLEPSASLQDMRQSLTRVAFVGTDRRAGRSLEHYRLEADTAKIRGAVDPAHPRTTRVYQVWLDSHHLLRRLTYTTVDKTVDLTYSRWGERLQVRRPAEGRVISTPGTSATQV